MNYTTRALATTAAAAITATLVGMMPAHAASSYYSSCDKLHRDFKHGVAKSQAAAKKQVRAGYGMPAYGKHARAVYTTNHSRLDRDNDGTACEA